MDWSGVDYLCIIVMFLSAVYTHSDGTHSLQDPLVSKRWNATFLCANEETNSRIILGELSQKHTAKNGL